MNKKSKRLYWRSIFRRVMARYEEVHCRYTATPSMDYERACDPTTGGGFPVGVVKPSTCDFIADVELAARRSLTTTEYVFFQQIFLQRNEDYHKSLLTEWGEEKFTKYKNTVEEKVGRMFKSRKIYPIYKYMAARDLR